MRSLLPAKSWLKRLMTASGLRRHAGGLMQLVQNGPDIPERLLQAHEDGRVVFFCGAGISYPAGLPGFGDLVERVRRNLNVEFSPPQASAFKRELYDSVLGLLEGEVVGNRERVRREVAKILQPDLTLPDATATHEALLCLSLTRDRRQRLITTNFDRLFEEVKRSNNLGFRSYEAPLLPVPKNRWDGVVYLHGLLAEILSASDLDRLVLSSGDFGLAYLTERWAARFVSELFRSLTVCFVGYSINDPVLRYMMDALAADRLLGESTPEVFAFGSYSRKDGGPETAAAEWRAKNVTPILYLDDLQHRYLHKTLHEWARIYRDGVLGKESIITRYAITKPVGSTEEDNFVGRLLWALSDRDGLPAKRFAEFEPLPSLDWIEPMSEPSYGHADLDRFGVRANAKTDEKLQFSLLVRPSPYTLSAPMRLVGHFGVREGKLDHVMSWLAHWLARHIDDEKLLLWVAGQGPSLHPSFAWHIERALEKYYVRPPMGRLWRLVLAGRLYDVARPFDLYSWRKRLTQGYSPALRLELKSLLSPRIRLSRPFRIAEARVGAGSVAAARVRDLVEWEIVLATAHARSALNRQTDNAQWRSALLGMLPDFTALLRDALDLMRELDGADDRSDLSYIAHASIAPHVQNRGFRDWTLLVDLARDAWLVTANESPEKARAEVQRWLGLPYPIFRRLAFFAATRRDVFSPEEALEMLLQDVWWLWSTETQREAMRLLVSIAADLGQEASGQLQEVILNGPDRQMFQENVETERMDRIIDREIWLRLIKFRDAGGRLVGAATAWLDVLAQRYPDWHLDQNDRDEFPFWMGEGDDWSTFTPTPIPRRELIAWLRQHQSADAMHRDDWQERCRTDFPRAASALLGLAAQGQWYADRWRSALQAWTEPALLAKSWRRLARSLASAPDDLLREAGHALAPWLETQSKVLTGQEEHFFTLARRYIQIYRNDPAEAGDDVIFRAINHPLGHAVEALLNWWHRQNLRDGQGLRVEVEGLFGELTNREVEIYRYGRVLLGSNLIALFRVDQDWTVEHLLPLLDWDRSEVEAAAVWKGFLWSPRLYPPLIAKIKASFLAAGRHYQRLGDHGEQYAGLLTFALLEAADLFSVPQQRAAIAALPEPGLLHSAQTLVDALEGAGEQRSAYWRNRVKPFIEDIWPKAAVLRTPAISEAFGRLCIASGDAFEEAFSTIRPWILPCSQPGIALHKLSESGQCTRFAETALTLLDAIIADDMRWPFSELQACLDQIKSGHPALENDHRYQRLHNLVRRLGD